MKIKILVDAHIFDHSFQGTATYIEGLYNALVKDDSFEIVLCAQDINKLKALFVDTKFKFIQLKSESKYRRLLYEIPSIIKREKIDYAHFQYITPLKKHCKFINTIHDLLFLDYPQYFPWSYRVLKKYLFKISAKKSDLVFTVSEFSKRQLVEHFKLDSKKVYITPNAVTPIKNPIKAIDEEILPYILCVGRFEPRKNQIQLLEAYRDLKLSQKKYKLVFIGSKKEKLEIDYFNELKSRIEPDIESFVFFKENLTKEELYGYYENASVFVFPSLAEGFGIPPLEAGALGTKVICSNQTAMKDFDFFKYSFDPNNEKLRDIIEVALEDQEYPYKEIQTRISEKYNWDSLAKEFAKTLKVNLH